MPLPTDPGGWYVTEAECRSFKDRVYDAVMALGTVIQGDSSLDQTPDGRQFKGLYARFLERVGHWYAHDSCFWGSTTDQGVVFAEEYNSFEVRYRQIGAQELPWSPGRVPPDQTSSPWPWVLGAVLLVGGVAGALYVAQRRASRRRALGAVRRSGVDGPSLYQLER